MSCVRYTQIPAIFLCPWYKVGFTGHQPEQYDNRESFTDAVALLLGIRKSYCCCWLNLWDYNGDSSSWKQFTDECIEENRIPRKKKVEEGGRDQNIDRPWEQLSEN